MKSTVFFFVRHGVTEHTGNRLSGRMGGVPLTEEGRAQAAAAAEEIAERKPNLLYSSPIDRCAETAAIIGEKVGLPVLLSDGLLEVDYGTWTNRTMKPLMKTKLWVTIQQQPSAVRFPEGESLREAQARSVDEIERLAGKHRGKRICCVTHADVIRLVFAHYLGVHLDLYQRIIIGPATISALSIGDWGPRAVTLNSQPRRLP